MGELPDLVKYVSNTSMVCRNAQLEHVLLVIWWRELTSSKQFYSLIQNSERP